MTGASFGGSHTARAQLLMDRGRFDQAAREFRAALVEDPNDPHAHAMLAVCLSEMDEHEEAVASARRAVAVAPDETIGHAMLATVLLEKDEPDEAETAIREALRLDPANPFCWGTLASIQLRRKRWSDGLEAAESGLAFDPEDVRCLNLRGMALVGLGRKEEAGAAVEAALRRDPENAATHANRGWALLHQGDHKQALDHFSQALRLEPDMEWARQGLVQSLRSRYFIYRWLLAYFLWAGRLGKKMSWGVVVVSYLAFRFLRTSARQYPEARFVLIPLLVACGLAIYLTWVGGPFFDTLLRCNRYGRYALNRNEKLASNWLILLLCVAVTLVLVAWQADIIGLYWSALLTVLLTLPVTRGLAQDEPGPRRRTLIFSGVMGVFVLGNIVAAAWGFGLVEAILLLAAALAFLAFQLLALRRSIHR